jgi:hypothetical protein
MALRRGEMAESEDFPVLSAGDLVKAFPDLRVGDILKINPGHLGGVLLNRDDVGQFVMIQKSGDAGRDLSVLLADEAEATSSSSDELGARVSRVEDAAVTLEVTSPPEEGREG